MAGKNASSTNLSPNIASALSYAPVVGWIAAIVFLIVEKNVEVKWNAVQSLLIVAAAWVIGFVLGITVVLAVFVPVVWLATLVLQLVLTVKVYQGKTVKLPLLGDWTNKIIKKV